MDQVTANYAAIQGIQQEMDCYIAPLGVSLSGTCTYKQPNKIHCDFGDPMEAKIVSDGKTMWISVPAYQTVLKMGAEDQDQEISPKHIMTFMFPEVPLARLKEGFVPTNVSSATLSGEKVWCLEVEPTAPESRISKAKLWVEQDSGAVRKYETMDKNGRVSCRVIFDTITDTDGTWLARDVRVEEGNGNLVGSGTISEIKLNPSIQDSLFDFQAPAGMMVLDEVPMIGIPMPDILPLE